MFKKSLLAFSMALMLALFSAPFAAAQAPQIPAEALAVYEKEAPLSQADIDTYVKVLPEMAKYQTDPEGAVKVFKDAGLSEVRLAYITSKIAIGQSMAMGLTAEQLQLDSIPKVLQPTDDETALIKKNLDALQKASMDIMSNVKQ